MDNLDKIEAIIEDIESEARKEALEAWKCDGGMQDAAVAYARKCFKNRKAELYIDDGKLHLYLFLDGLDAALTINIADMKVSD